MDSIRRKNAPKVVVAMSPKENLRFPTGQAGGCRNKIKIVVAMSGGVDSSVTAALLKKQNFEVKGVFMKLNDFSSKAEAGARKVARTLKIPFYVFNFKKEFKKRIISCFLAEYKRGRTPNPCVVCNKEIKFGSLLEKALSLGADFVATGHYARLRREILNPKSKTQNYRYKLLKGKDKEKDQSYFLWRLNQRQLKRVLFPVGGYTKNQVRRLAKKFKLPVSETSESQEICFIQTTINDFLKKHLKRKPGGILSKEGRVLGRHQGLWFYTIGQRKGLGLSGGPAFAPPSLLLRRVSKASAGKPYYIMDKDLKKNILIVTKNKRDLSKKELIAKEVNWISGKRPGLPIKARVKIRYRQKSVPAKIYKIRNTRYKMLFNRPQPAITPGQSAVFYSGQELLGGGIIN